MLIFFLVIATLIAVCIYGYIQASRAEKALEQRRARTQNQLIRTVHQRMLLDQEMLAVAKMLMDEAERHAANNQHPSDQEE